MRNPSEKIAFIFSYPSCKFKLGKMEDGMLYGPDKFTHAICLYFTIYYVKDKRKFFENVYKWLKPGGYLVLHMVNRDKFDPMIPPSDPLLMVSAQKYAKKRITSSYVRFYDMDYKAEFKLDKENDIGFFIEKIQKDNGEVRYNEHKLYMETQKKILGMAKKSGFILENKIDLVNVQYEYQYLYILKKPE